MRTAGLLDGSLQALLGFEDPSALSRLGALDLALVWERGQWWRVGTAAIVHGSAVHLVLNVVSLWALGPTVERILGAWVLAVVFWSGAVGGSLAAVASAEAAIVVGASGGVFALGTVLVGAGLWGAPAVRERMAGFAHMRLGGWLLAWLAFGELWPLLGAGPGISQSGHIGGALVGLLHAGALTARFRLARLLAAAALFGLFAAGVVVGRAPLTRPGYHAVLGFHAVEAGEMAAARRHFERGLELAPGDPLLANAVAYALAEEGVELARARALVGRALVEAPGEASFWDTAGWIRCRSGEPAAGVVALAFARSREDFPEVRAHLRDCESAAVDGS
jgi:membrane associated rhomboid family serine protease